MKRSSRLACTTIAIAFTAAVSMRAGEIPIDISSLMKQATRILEHRSGTLWSECRPS
jgi:hypothetical protein